MPVHPGNSKASVPPGVGLGKANWQTHLLTLDAHLVARAEPPTRIGRGSPDRIPAILLARLALDRSLHRRKLGSELLWDALSRAAAANRQAAARIVVVDAIDDNAAGFYVHHRLQRDPRQPRPPGTEDERYLNFESRRSARSLLGPVPSALCGAAERRVAGFDGVNEVAVGHDVPLTRQESFDGARGGVLG